MPIWKTGKGQFSRTNTVVEAKARSRARNHPASGSCRRLTAECREWMCGDVGKAVSAIIRLPNRIACFRCAIIQS